MCPNASSLTRTHNNKPSLRPFSTACLAPVVRKMRYRFPKRKRGRRQGLKWRRTAESERMKMENLKLFLKNRSILAENERLRARAVILHQEKQALLSHLLLTNNQAYV